MKIMKKETNALAIINGTDKLATKKALFNLVTNAETKFSDMVNQIFTLKGFAFVDAEVTNRDTGIKEVRERVVAVDADGHTYHSVASGIVNSCKNLARFFGKEENGFITLDPEITVTVERKPTANGGNTYIVSIAE